MIRFKNEGSNGPEYSSVEVSVFQSGGTKRLDIIARKAGGSHINVVLGEEAARYLHGELGRVFSAPREKPFEGTL